MTPKSRASRRPAVAADARASVSSPTILVTVDCPPVLDAEPASDGTADAAEPLSTAPTLSESAGDIRLAAEPVVEAPNSGWTPPAAQIFGQYKLLFETCRDALSTTYACERDGISSALAIRVFNRRFTDAAQIRQIQRAAATAAELTHANIVVVYENGIEECGAPYVVSDWVESDNLAEVLSLEKRLDIARFLQIFQQVCDALIEAHGRQLLHRNLSPDKILLTQDACGHEAVKIKDFGMPPDPVKNAFYLSAEQCVDANKVDARADIYSLGCIMYEALVGTPPFVGYAAKQASLDILHDLANRYSPHSSEHKALKLLDCIIAKCLQRKPSKRFGSARELAAALSMVQDCLLNGSKRRLPGKAERLLLFRFLDLFDRKIVACAFAYLCLGMFCVKYLGEIQLQKYIDEAQLALVDYNHDRAQNRWKAALRQAYLMGKPESLKAELHWALGDAYQDQMIFGFSSASHSAIAGDAVNQYSQALQYYGKGTYHQSDAMKLCRSMGYLWYNVNRAPDSLQDVQTVTAQADKLYNQKRYAECAKLCDLYFEKHTDETLANLAACSYNELALKSPPRKALRLFERAQYYMNLTGDAWADHSISNNLTECYALLGIAMSHEPHQEQARKAILEGDLLAAMGELYMYGYNGHQNVRDALLSYLRMQRESKREVAGKESAKHALVAWERLLKLQVAAFGNHNEKLALTYSSIADCHRAMGDDERQRQALKNYFAVADRDKEWDGFKGNTLYYANVLEKLGQRGQAIEFLSKTLKASSPFDSENNALHLKLIDLYVKNKQTAMANVVLSELIEDEY